MQDRQIPTPPSPTRSDEIDLRELFSYVGRFFDRLFRGTINSILLLRTATRRHFWLLLGCASVGAGLGFTFYASFQPYYNSQMMVSSKYYNLEMMQGLIEELNLLAEDKNTSFLAKKLAISPQEAAFVRAITVVPANTTDQIIQIEQVLNLMEGNKEITADQLKLIRIQLTSSFSNYLIIVSTHNSDILEAIETGLVHYLNDNPYVQRRVAIEHQNLISLRDKLTNDLARLSELKSLQSEVLGRLTETPRSGSNNVILGTPENANDPLNVYREDIKLYGQLLSTNKDIELNHSLEVISGFTPYGEPASLSLKGTLLLGAALGLASAYLIILLIGINQALNRYEARYQARKMYA
jgi:hypothetical protein